jgi:hypothetical protein
MPSFHERKWEMSKNWTYDNSAKVLTRTYTTKVVNKETGKEEVLTLADPLMVEMNALYISVSFDDFDEVEELTAVNGIKQKLDDAIARSKDMTLAGAEQREVQEELYNRMAVDRKWNLEGKERGLKGPSVSLAVAVPPLLAAGFTVESIAKMFGKTVEVIEKVLKTGKE